MLNYEEPLFRPPSEADSLILQIDRGCPYNRCTFCGMYKGIKYRCKPLNEVLQIIKEWAAVYGQARRIFLADGDVMRRSFAELKAILTAINDSFPALSRVNAYATGSAIDAKSDEELIQLKTLNLNTLYLGLESGDDLTLKNVKKGENSELMIRAVKRAGNCGLRMSIMVLLGLAGQERSKEHAFETAKALNKMQAPLLAFLRVIPVPGTEINEAVKSGSFKQLSEFGVTEELRHIIAALELDKTIVRANHSSNIVTLKGRLPKDKENMLAELDELLKSGYLDKNSPGAMPFVL